MKQLKRAIVLLLAVLMAFAVVGCGGGENSTATQESKEESKEPTLADLTLGEIDRATLEKAVQQIALAYYYKNPYCQYDSGLMTIEAKASGVPHRTTYQEIQNIAWDDMNFSQCSEYCFNVYWALCGFEFMGDRSGYGDNVYNDKYKVATITGYDVKHTELGLTDAAAAVEIVRTQSRPGDIILSYGKSGDGHVMMIVGDIYGDGVQYALHCWPVGGGNFNQETGTAGHEPNGSITLQTVEDLLLTSNGTPNWSLNSDKGNARWYLYRPFEMPECQACKLTPEAVTRLTYNNIAIDKTADVSIYDSIEEGQAITINEIITNNSKETYKNLKVVEYVPEGATLKAQDPIGTADGKTLSWNLEIGPGETAIINYTIVNNKKAGETLELPAGLIDTIPSRTYSLRVGYSKFSKSQLEVLKAVVENGLTASLSGNEFMDLNFVNVFYKDLLGLEINLPATVADYLKLCFQEKKDNIDDVYMLFERALSETNQVYHDMIIPKHLGGYQVNTGTDSLLRVMEIVEGYYEVGDIFVSYGDKSSTNKNSIVNNKDIELYIYLGNDTVVQYTANGAKIVTFTGTADRMLRKNFFTVLRPSLVMETKKDVAMPDLKSTVSVKTFDELVAAGTAGGKVVEIDADITLTADVALAGKQIKLNAGKTLTLGNFSISCDGVDKLEGTVNAETGRILVTVTSADAVTATLAACADQCVKLVCDYDGIITWFDCKDHKSYFNKPTDMAKNFTQLITLTPEGWTVVMNSGYVSNSSPTIKAKNLTIDVNGMSLGFRTLKGENVKIVNSNPSKGGFYFRGADSAPADSLDIEIDATGITIYLGWSTANTANITVNGKLTCKEVKLNNGSTIKEGTGKIEYK